MKTFEYILLGLLFIPLFYCCETEIDYKDELPKDKLVIYSMVQENENITISVAKSAIPGKYNTNNNPNDAFVNDANIELYINNQLVETKLKADTLNIYIFNYKAQFNDEVFLKVKHEDFEQVTGSSMVNLSKPKIDSSNFYFSFDTIRYNYQGIVYTLYQPSLILYLEIRDDGVENNFYKIDGSMTLNYNRDTLHTKQHISLSDAKLIWENTSGVLGNNNSIDYNGYNVFSNKLFKGSVYKVKLKIELFYDTEYMYKSANGENIQGSISISKIDNNSYKYISSIMLYQNANGFNSEPVRIINSVDGGYGFIGSKNSVSIPVLVKLF